MKARCAEMRALPRAAGHVPGPGVGATHVNGMAAPC